MSGASRILTISRCLCAGVPASCRQPVHMVAVWPPLCWVWRSSAAPSSCSACLVLNFAGAEQLGVLLVQYLSSPITDKETLAIKTEHVRAGISAHQGWRKGMEDAHIAHRYPDSDCYIFGVFDGHGGPEVAQFCSKYLPSELEQNEQFKSGNFAESLAWVFHRMDERLRSPEGQAEMEAMRRSASAKGEAVRCSSRSPRWGSSNQDAALHVAMQRAHRAKAKTPMTCCAS